VFDRIPSSISEAIESLHVGGVDATSFVDAYTDGGSSGGVTVFHRNDLGNFSKQLVFSFVSDYLPRRNSII
jgi:hypothetical protein